MRRRDWAWQRTMVVALALALVLTLAIGGLLWGSVAAQLATIAEIRQAIGAAPVGTPSLGAAERLALSRDLVQAENAVRSAQGQLFASVAQLVLGSAVIGSLIFTWRNLQVAERNQEVAREGQVTERFAKAVDQLGSVRADATPNTEIRLGGIYTLERIAQNHADYYWTVMEALTAYVRQRAPWPPAHPRAPGARTPPAPDVQAVLRVLGRRNPPPPRPDPGRPPLRLDLRETDLRGAELYDASLWEADLWGAHLEGARLWGARLVGANLENADCRGAEFMGASLDGAVVKNATFEGAVFRDDKYPTMAKPTLRGVRIDGAVGLRALIADAEINGEPELPPVARPCRVGRDAGRRSRATAALTAENERLQDERAELFGRLGYRRAQLAATGEHIKALEAPKEPAASPSARWPCKVADPPNVVQVRRGVRTTRWSAVQGLGGDAMNHSAPAGAIPSLAQTRRLAALPGSTRAATAVSPSGPKATRGSKRGAAVATPRPWGPGWTTEPSSPRSGRPFRPRPARARMTEPTGAGHRHSGRGVRRPRAPRRPGRHGRVIGAGTGGPRHPHARAHPRRARAGGPRSTSCEASVTTATPGPAGSVPHGQMRAVVDRPWWRFR